MRSVLLVTLFEKPVCIGETGIRENDWPWPEGNSGPKPGL
jgi:hypothetical protein